MTTLNQHITIHTQQRRQIGVDFIQRNDLKIVYARDLLCGDVLASTAPVEHEALDKKTGVMIIAPFSSENLSIVLLIKKRLLSRYDTFVFCHNFKEPIACQSSDMFVCF